MRRNYKIGFAEPVLAVVRSLAFVGVYLSGLFTATASVADAGQSECAKIGFFRTAYVPGTYGIFTPPDFKKIEEACSKVRLPTGTKRERIIIGYLTLLGLDREDYGKRPDIPLQSYAFAAGVASLTGQGTTSYELLAYAAERGEPNAIFGLVKGAPLFSKLDDGLIRAGLKNLIDEDIEEDNACTPIYALYLQSSSYVLHDMQPNSEWIVHQSRQILAERCMALLAKGERALVLGEPWKVNPWTPALPKR